MEELTKSRLNGNLLIKFKKLIVQLSLLSFFFGTCLSQSATPEPQPKPLKIGVVLSGGGARGLAHIGVLEWFEQHRIPVHYVAGTSMGGLVGALYAMGM